MWEAYINKIKEIQRKILYHIIYLLLQNGCWKRQISYILSNFAHENIWVLSWITIRSMQIQQLLRKCISGIFFNKCQSIFNLNVLQMQQSFVLRYSKLWQRKVINMELTFLILEGRKSRQQYEITFTIHEVNKMENYIMCWWDG